MLDPRSISNPSDVTAESVLLSESDEILTLVGPRRFGFDLYWLCEAALGTLDGDVGLRVGAEASSFARCELAASFRRLISLDEQRRLRLQVFKRTDRKFPFASRISVSVQAVAPIPDALDELAAALLGVHEGQWLQEIPCPLAKRGEKLLVAPAAVARGLQNLGAFLKLDDWVKKQLAGVFGQIASEADLAGVAQRMRPVLELRDSIYRKAPEALGKKLTADVSWRYHAAASEAALLDCSFSFTDEGLRLYRAALAGDYTEVLTAPSDHVTVRRGVLSHDGEPETWLELHLPFLSRREWSARLESMARMEVECDGDGRLLIYTVENAHRIACRNEYQSTLALAGSLAVGRLHSTNFTLSYCDQRRLKAVRLRATLSPVIGEYKFDPELEKWLATAAAPASAGDVEASLSLCVPGSSVGAWLDAPGEESPDYFRVYSEVSRAVQRAMRRWLPYAYFADPDRYDDLSLAFPLIVYQLSRPFFGKPKNDFTYDVMSQQSLQTVIRTAAGRLAKELTRAGRLLAACGKTKTAEIYTPKHVPRVLRAARRSHRQIESLLVAESTCVNALVNLGCKASRLRAEMAKDPKRAVRDLTESSADLVKAFHGRLKRLYGGQDFLSLSSLLLVEATSALSAACGRPAGIPAVLRLRRGEAEQAGSLEATFVNGAYGAGRIRETCRLSPSGV